MHMMDVSFGVFQWDVDLSTVMSMVASISIVLVQVQVCLWALIATLSQFKTLTLRVKSEGQQLMTMVVRVVNCRPRLVC